MTRYAEALASLTLAAANQATTIEAAEQRERQEHLATQQRLIESLNALASRRQASRPGVPA